MALAGALRRISSAALSAAIATTTVGGFLGATLQPASAATTCATPGKDGAAGTLGGVYNAYFKPIAGTLAAGTTTIRLSSATPDTAGGGANKAIAAGDLLLVIQMQDGTFNAANSTAYGNGSSGSGYTNLSSAGLYEYVAAVSIAGTTVTIKGTGTGNGLINTYHEAAAGGTSGQETYQIVRVPQYITATLGSNFTAARWDGATGGVAALDIASTLNLGGANIYVSGDGFSGGGLSVATAAATGWSTADFVDSSLAYGGTNTAPAYGSKGEGVMGTPNYAFSYTNFSAPGTPSSPTVVKHGANGYPGGDQSRGAPGNAGGGGTDADPPANDQNSGGGGGGNGGAGGNGGYPWTPTYSGTTPEFPQYPYVSGTITYSATNFSDLGGRGGAALTPSATRVFMGGGGGAGVNNNGSNNNAFNQYGSSGGPGGGILMLRIANASGAAAAIYANGTSGLAPLNDGGGGGGAGGSAVITSPSSFSGITVYASGAAGTTANAPNASITQQHGPGGGGGGGAVFSSSPVTASVGGGAAGTTTTFATTYGATAGSSGVVNTSVAYTSIPGVASGAECGSGTSTNTLYTGPYDSADATYKGAADTGSFDGNVAATDDNDFVPALIPLTGLTSINSGTVPGTPIGNTLTFSATPSVNVPHVVYYNNTAATGHVITLNAQAPAAPAGWTVQLCEDTSNPAGNTGVLTTAPSSPKCTAGGTVTAANCTGGSAGYGWITVGSAAASTTNAQFCQRARAEAHSFVYWTVYTPPSSVTAFARYDASVAAYDDESVPAYNAVHDELYAGVLALTKSFTVVSSGCPSGVTPAYPALAVCPGGILRYTIDYRSVVAGGSTEAANIFATASFTSVATAAGSLAITDNGTLSGVSQTTTPNWATFTNGLTLALTAGLGTGNASCGSGASACGDSTAGTTFTGGTAGSTSFTATIGGATFRLYPIGVSGQTGQGTLTFAVKVK